MTAVLPLAAPATSVDREVLDVFGRLGLGVDSNTVTRPMIEALLKSVDPRGRILAADEETAAGGGATVQSAEAWAEGLFYLKLRGLNAGGATNISESLRAAMKAQPSGMILDLRDAGGNSLEAADALLSMFVEQGTPLYSLRGTGASNGPPRTAARADLRLDGVTCALIVNEETRDACELAAAVLKALPNVVTLGWQTRGDAGIRTAVALSSGERLLVAARWAVPAKGGEYHGRGVKPDIALSSTSVPDVPAPAPIPGLTRAPSERALGSARMRERIGGDAALQRACDLLVGLKALRKTTSAWVPEPAPLPAGPP
jgi:hypothetical protein